MQIDGPLISGVTMQSFCVDEQTEILTHRGWITHSSLHGGETVLSLDLQSQAICWEPAISVYRFEHAGPLTRWKSAKMDALTSLTTGGRSKPRAAVLRLLTWPHAQNVVPPKANAGRFLAPTQCARTEHASTAS